MKNYKIKKAPKNCYITLKDDDYMDGLFYEKIHYFVTIHDDDNNIDIIPIVDSTLDDGFLLLSANQFPQNKKDFNSIISLNKKEFKTKNVPYSL